MSERSGIGHQTRTIVPGALIAASLVFLGAAVTLRNLSANIAPLGTAVADFVVTSSQDAGPATLRDAILAADRLSSRAHILITAQRITIESSLPALINPHGIDIDAATGAGILDAEHQATGAALQINSPASRVKGLHILNAQAAGLIVNAPGVQLDSLTVSHSKVGVVLTASARGCVIRTSAFEHDETGLMAEAGSRDISILSTIFRDNTRAGFWFVGAADKGLEAPASGKANPAIRERARVIEGVFERNASGMVLANQPTLVQKSRFLGNRESAVLVLGGAARIEESEIRDSGGYAVSVTSGKYVVLAHNTLIDNSSIAIMVRDSDITIERNTLKHNGLGIVAMNGANASPPVIRDNVISQTSADAITLIGGPSLLQRNQVIDNRGAALRSLDLVRAHGRLKVEPHMDGNQFQGNGIDTPVPGLYMLPGAL